MMYLSLACFSLFLSYAQRSATYYLNTPTLNGQPVVPNSPEMETILHVDIVNGVCMHVLP